LQGVSEGDFEVTMRTLERMKTNLLGALEGYGTADEGAATAMSSARRK
jgi:hypothetical protein